jgi:hypothetical protein
VIEWAPLSWISGDSLRLERIRVVTGVVRVLLTLTSIEPADYGPERMSHAAAID